ncbi:uncharacterized protein DSM5745_01317 [Aspergillus mulundensis]|uniref:F-box domain-containing protein n=1 Tax=Aspergillus mulundensis TaxID=1810919 RepID=A0A3D8T614_9EURO|nr:hypothetical protein DSM5745_01317 [Aspergillus mulundensis]RDW93995.1 hypothetical protein DSM5745_01317 [Aspergillus mulundensis]
MRHYCVVCGVNISRAAAAPGTVPEESLSWYQELRVAVRRHDDLDAATISGLGFINSSNELTVAEDYQSRFDDANVNLHTYFPFYDLEQRTWSFTLHAICWEILLQRVPEGAANIAKLSNVFFQIVFCTIWSRHRYMRPGHDFGGAAQFQKPVGDPIRRMTDEGFAQMLSRPSQFCDVPEILSSLSQFQKPRSRHRRFVPMTVRIPSAGFDLFSSLPAEVLHMILSILSSVDIRHLRLASRRVASVTDPASLPQSFWRSRFCADAEMGFALPTNESGHQNWRDAYFLLKDTLSDSSCVPRVKNRLRIWSLVGINATLLAGHMIGDGLHGDQCTGTILIPAEAETLTSDVLPGRMVRTSAFVDEHNLLPSGSRKLHDRVVVLPLGTCAIIRVNISTILFNSEKFVSGLQLGVVNTSTQAITNLSLGFISPDHQLIEIAPTVRITGFELATCPRGVTGIRAIVDRGPQPQWVGDTGNGEAQFAFGILNFTREGSDILLVASFDAFKMIALGVTEGSSEVGFDKPFVSQPVWTPTYPRKTVALAPEPWNPRPDTSSPILNIDFGGPTGERLTRLTRIVSHMVDKSSPFVGLSFYLDDQSFFHFGQRGSMEVSSFIDGPGGELISSIIVERSAEDDRVLSQRIVTNLGNELIFSSNELEHSQVAEHIPVLNDGLGPNPFIKMEEKIIETLKPHPGHQITGLTATTEADAGFFLNLGLQCEKLQQAPDSSSAGEKKGVTNSASLSASLASSLGSYIIAEAGNGLRAYTSAALQSVKCIRISNGSTRRPRLDNEVSGLWFEYHGSCPSIVGQWLCEGASMSLDTEEIITGITIWLSDGRYSRAERVYNGRVIRVSITTTLRTVSYPEELPPTKYTVLRFHGSHLEKLSHMVWVFNNAWDFPRVIPIPTLSGAKVTLWHPNDFLATRPFASPDKVLWKGISVTDNLISITGYHGHNNGNLVTGLKFTYSSGTSREMGDVTGHQTHNVLTFEPDEEIQTVEFIADSRRLLDVVFHSEKGSSGKSRRRALVDAPDSEAFERHEVDTFQRTFQSHYWGSDTPDEGVLSGEVVGIWGFLMADEALVTGFVLLEES